MAKQYYQVDLTKPDMAKQYQGKGNAKAVARVRARAKAAAAGEDPDLLAEAVHVFIGPSPRTFAGNPV